MASYPVSGVTCEKVQRGVPGKHCGVLHYLLLVMLYYILLVMSYYQARIQGVGAGARAHPWGGVSPFEMHYSIAFNHQFITGRPPLGEILYPPLIIYC